MTADPIRDAAEAVVRAIRDAGPRPDVHRAVMQRHRQEWPTLWQALDQLVKAASDGT